jgi:tripartite-type tricarboxylate transporter receptor subunit TctC
MLPKMNASLSRPLFALAACVLAWMLPNDGALAVYPERIVKIVVPFAPGGGTDSVARTLAQELAKDLGQSVIIENKPGAGTIVGTQAVATSEGDGYTLLMGRADRALLQYRRGQREIAVSFDRGSDRGRQGRAR